MEMERKGKKKKVEWNWKNEGRKKKAPKMGDSDGKIRLRGRDVRWKKIMENKEFPRGEFSNFRCVL